MSEQTLALYCDVLNARYTLAVANTDSQEVFSTLEEAVERAPAWVKEPTKLVIFNERGKEIVHTTIHPIPRPEAHSRRSSPSRRTTESGSPD